MTITIVDHHLPFDTHNVYDVTFYEDSISTTVTHTSSIVDAWIAGINSPALHHPLVVGLDVEWRPNFTRGFENPVATLQLCVGSRCLIFQILHSPVIPGSLVDFLRNPCHTFVGVGINDDVEKLRKNYYLVVAMTVDLRGLAEMQYGSRELRTYGLEGLTRRVLGKEMMKPKNVTMSRWDDRWLTPAQVQYACVDAFLSYEIGRILMFGDQN